MAYTFGLLLRFMLAACLVWLPVVPYAQSIPKSSISYGASGGRLVSGAIQGVTGAAQWAANATTGAATFTESVTARVAANDVAMSSARTIPWAGVARAAAKALPVIAAGAAVYEIYDLLRCGATGGSVSCDAGLPQVEIAGFKCGGNFFGSTPVAACTLSTESRAAQARAADDRVTTTIETHTCDSPTNAEGGCVGAFLIHYPWGAVTRIGTDPRWSKVTSLECPKVGGISGSPGPDGKCKGGLVAPASETDLASKFEEFGDKAKAADYAREVARDVDLAPLAGPAGLTGPSSVPGTPKVVTTTPAPTPENPSPAPVSTTTYPSYNFNYAGDTYTYNLTETTTKPDGSTETTTAPEPLKACGLPGQPVCTVKVDETGTPSSVESPTAKITEALTDPKAVATNPESFFPTFPTLNWAFALPTGCSAIPLPAFAPFIDSIDVCTFTPMFHDLMTVVWLVGGVFGAIQLFLRDALAS